MKTFECMKIFKHFWSSKKHHLEDMDMRDLVIAYVQYPAIQVYFIISLVGLAYISMNNAWSVNMLIISVAMVFLYPMIWYVLHRYILHSRFLYRFEAFAAVWKRIHFDHHNDPNDLRILFGALYTTLPTVGVFSMPVGWLIGGWYGAVMALTASVVITMFYEFCHCIQHLHYTPKSRFLRDMKRLHLLHHFRDETGNFGITNFFWDRFFNTFYDKSDNRSKSPTVFNLGYDEVEASRYPWVADLEKETK